MTAVLPETVVLPYAPWPDDWEGPIVEFRLTYQGPLPPEGRGTKSKVAVKHAIRREFHRQLAELWRTHPFMAGYAAPLTWVHPRPASIEYNGELYHIWSPRQHPGAYGTLKGTLSLNYERCGFQFLPLIGGAFGKGRETVCSLDILFLRRDAPGALVKNGGDIDNRIKVLFDALKMPQECVEVRGFGPEQGERPFFCLLEDDSVITEVKITTDRLLTPLATDERIHDVHLVIHVKTMAAGPDFADIGFRPEELAAKIKPEAPPPPVKVRGRIEPEPSEEQEEEKG